MYESLQFVIDLGISNVTLKTLNFEKRPSKLVKKFIKFRYENTENEYLPTCVTKYIPTLTQLIVTKLPVLVQNVCEHNISC